MIAPPALPREHGAWVMLSFPLVLGLALAPWPPSAAWLVPPASVLVFLAHYAWVPAIQRKRAGKAAPEAWFRSRWVWGGAYLAGAAVAFATAVGLCPSPRDLLVTASICAACGVVYAAAAAFGSGRALAFELVGMAGMALAAPMVAAAGGRPLDGTVAAAAIVALAYSLSSLAFVRAFEGLREGRAAATARCLLVHLALAGGAVAAWRLGADGVVLGTLAIPFARTLFGLVRPPANLRKLGFRELGVASALAFGAVAAIVS